MEKILTKDNGSEKKKIASLSLVKVLAMLLIIQSHSDQLFPPSISFMATGGALGNELFFLTSGYLFHTSRGLSRTIARRFVRLYIPTYIMTGMLFLIGKLRASDFMTIKGLAQILLWPSAFWFVSAVFFDGILLHVLLRSGILNKQFGRNAFAAALVFLDLIVYIWIIPDKSVWIVEDAKLLGGSFYYKCIYSFFVFSIGYGIRQMNTQMRIRLDSHICFIAAIISFVIFYGFKVLLNKQLVPMQMQILSQPITVICVLAIFLWITGSARIERWLVRSVYVRNVVNTLGGITLEAFLVQFEIISAIAILGWPFPVSYLIAIILILSSAWIFWLFDKKACDMIIKRFRL